MTRLLLVAMGGAVGSAARWGMTVAVHRVLPPNFPWGTFFVNIAGCLLFGLAAGFVEGRDAAGTATRLLVLVGILGGFTTFSSFGWETFELLREGLLLRAALNVMGQTVAGVGAAALGWVLVKSF